MRRRSILVALLTVGLLGATTALLRAADEEDEGKEVKVKLKDCPKPVQKTLKEQAKGAKLPKEVDKQTRKDGTVVYEADVVIDGKNYEIVVAEDGKLISKKLDKEEDEKKGKEEKGKEKD